MHQEENLTCLDEMMANIAELRPDSAASIPLVLQYNKRDLPDAAPVAALNSLLNKRKTVACPAVAVRGEGVAETFAAVLSLTVKDLARRYMLTGVGGAQSDQEWSADALEEIFGKRSLVSESPGGTPETERRTVHLDMDLPADLAGGERSNARTNEALVKSYAEAAAALTLDAERLREERDLAQRRLADVLDVLAAARTLSPDASRNPLLSKILGCLARELEAPYASLLIRAPDGGLRTACLSGLDRDPLAQTAASRLQEFLKDSLPKWHDSSQDRIVGGILTANDPPLGSVVSAVVRTGPDGPPIALALLYHGPSAAPPRYESIKHVAALAQALGLFVDPLATGDSGDDWEASL